MGQTEDIPDASWRDLSVGNVRAEHMADVFISEGTQNGYSAPREACQEPLNRLSRKKPVMQTKELQGYLVVTRRVMLLGVRSVVLQPASDDTPGQLYPEVNCRS